MKTYKLFIGSNNRTGRLENDKIKRIMAIYHNGFTIEKAKGFWKGSEEQTAIVTVADQEKTILKTIAILKNKLQQETIAYQKTTPLLFL